MQKVHSKELTYDKTSGEEIHKFVVHFRYKKLQREFLKVDEDP